MDLVCVDVIINGQWNYQIPHFTDRAYRWQTVQEALECRDGHWAPVEWGVVFVTVVTVSAHQTALWARHSRRMDGWTPVEGREAVRARRDSVE